MKERRHNYGQNYNVHKVVQLHLCLLYVSSLPIRKRLRQNYGKKVNGQSVDRDLKQKPRCEWASERQEGKPEHLKRPRQWTWADLPTNAQSRR